MLLGINPCSVTRDIPKYVGIVKPQILLVESNPRSIGRVRPKVPLVRKNPKNFPTNDTVDSSS